MAYQYLIPLIRERGQFDISEVDLSREDFSGCCPGIFLASKQDSLVPFEHINSLFSRYRAEKEMYFLEESHNQPRNLDVIAKVFQKLQKYLACEHSRAGKPHYYSFLPPKELSRKKLELTISSKSQKCMLPLKPPNIQYQSIKHPTLPHPKVQKQHSCFIPVKKPLRDIENEHWMTHASNTPKNSKNIPKKQPEFFGNKGAPSHGDKSDSFGCKGDSNVSKDDPNSCKGEEYLTANKGESQSSSRGDCSSLARPKFASKAISISITQKLDSKIMRERKTLQHISHKHPPIIELRPSLESKLELH